MLEVEAKFDERREQSARLDDNLQCERRQGGGVVSSEEGSGVEDSLGRCTRQRKRTNSEFRARSAVQSPSLLAEVSSNELGGGEAQVEIRGRHVYEEMDCGDNAHSTGRNGKVREGECGMCDDSSPMQRVKRVQNAEEYDRHCIANLSGRSRL